MSLTILKADFKMKRSLFKEAYKELLKETPDEDLELILRIVENKGASGIIFMTPESQKLEADEIWYDSSSNSVAISLK
jgi:hypothetical protein